MNINRIEFSWISHSTLTFPLEVSIELYVLKIDIELQESFSGLDIVLVLITAALLIGRSSEIFQKIDKVSRYVSISKVSCRLSLLNHCSCFHSHRSVPYLTYLSISYRCPSKVPFSF